MLDVVLPKDQSAMAVKMAHDQNVQKTAFHNIHKFQPPGQHKAHLPHSRQIETVFYHPQNVHLEYSVLIHHMLFFL